MPDKEIREQVEQVLNDMRYQIVDGRTNPHDIDILEKRFGLNGYQESFYTYPALSDEYGKTPQAMEASIKRTLKKLKKNKVLKQHWKDLE